MSQWLALDDSNTHCSVFRRLLSFLIHLVHENRIVNILGGAFSAKIDFSLMGL